MSHLKTVFDFKRSLPASLQHEEIYYDFMEKQVGIEVDIDLVQWEESTIGVGERNLLQDLSMVNKFMYPSMDKGFNLKSYSLAKHKGKAFGEESLNHGVVRKENFLMPKTIEFTAKAANLCITRKPGIGVPDIEPLFRHRSAATEGAVLTYVSSIVTVKPDMRHLFLKGYFFLMQYNLAVVAGSVCFYYSDVPYDVKYNCSVDMKMNCLMKYLIVVDMEHFTKSEIWLLALMAAPYPNRRYGEENIYNNVVIEGDSLVFCTPEASYDFDDSYPVGSTENLWEDLLNIAIKMDAMEDLRKVIRDFRGIPSLLRSVSQSTDRKVYELMYPRSYSLVMGIESLGLKVCRPRVTKQSRYFATSKNLLADLLLGKMMELSAFNIIEDFGGLGTVCIPTGKAFSDMMYNNILLNAGLNMESKNDNPLVREWIGIKGCSIPVSFGGELKNYVQRMTMSLRDGVVDVVIPQLLHAMPFSECRQTTWAVIRGYKFQEFQFRHCLENGGVLENSLANAFSWVIGLTNSLPKVGYNALGMCRPEAIIDAETEYEFRLVRHFIDGDVLDRSNEFETGMVAFYSTAFQGTRCCVVFNESGVMELKAEEVPGFY